jgi:hypothetical protein
MRRLALASLLALAACGGGGSSAPTPTYAVKMMARLAQIGPVPAEAGFNASIITPGAATTISDSVAQQASALADVALTIGPAKSLDFSSLQAYLQLAPANVKWVYLYDELYWTDSIQLGLGKSEIEAAASVVHQAGKLTAITVLPDVVMAAGFSVPAGLDVVVIDLYPAGRPTNLSCPGANPYTALLQCSVQRLRATGYAGQVWYAYEAFGDSAVPDLRSKLAQQRETIAAAPSLGITGLVSFGYYDDTHTNLLAPLYPGHGSDIDALVNCTDC